VPLYVDARGLTTRTLRQNGIAFSVDFDFVDHRLVLRTEGGRTDSFGLHDGLSVAAFDRQFHELLDRGGVDTEILETPYGVPMTTPFPEDDEHASYQPEYVEAYWHALLWIERVLVEYAGWFAGKSSPVHLFWHSLDLAVSRFSGRAAPVDPEADPVTREAYCNELISFGFWAGEERMPEACFYSYTYPEPDGIRDRPLTPVAASWVEWGPGSLAILPYNAVRESADPRSTLLEFLESAYQAGAGLRGWDIAALESSYCPPLR
jgi:hypothetical protein